MPSDASSRRRSPKMASAPPGSTLPSRGTKSTRDPADRRGHDRDHGSAEELPRRARHEGPTRAEDRPGIDSTTPSPRRAAAGPRRYAGRPDVGSAAAPVASDGLSGDAAWRSRWTRNPSSDFDGVVLGNVARRRYGRCSRGPVRSRGRVATSAQRDDRQRLGREHQRRARGRGPRRRPGRGGPARARRICDGARSIRPRAWTKARPTPVMTAAIPSPNAATRITPHAGRPAAIVASRISSALADGTRPPARPRTNRLRQVIVEPAGGRWRVADAAVRVLEVGAGRRRRGRGRARSVVVRPVRRGRARAVVVVVARGRARSRRWSWSASRPAARRAAIARRASVNSIQPPMTRIDTAATSGATRTTRSGGSRVSAASTRAASARIPMVCDTLTASPSPTACRGVPRVPTR